MYEVVICRRNVAPTKTVQTMVAGRRTTEPRNVRPTVATVHPLLLATMRPRTKAAAPITTTAAVAALIRLHLHGVRKVAPHVVALMVAAAVHAAVDLVAEAVASAVVAVADLAAEAVAERVAVAGEPICLQIPII